MIICEIGHNHMGDLKYLDKYINTLIDSSPDAITFQFREPERYIGDGKKLLLPKNLYKKYTQKLHKAGILCGIALGDINQIDFFQKLSVDFYKILSKDIKNNDLLQKIFKTGKKIYVSTGMSNNNEIATFLRTFKKYKNKIVLIHTQLTYELSDINLRAIPMMEKKFNIPVAFGSHAINPNVLYTAIAFNPESIFFYVKGDKYKKHFDEEHSIRLSDCKNVIKNLKELKISLGKGVKVKMENLIKKGLKK